MENDFILGSKFSDNEDDNEDEDDDNDNDYHEEESSSGIQTWRTLDAFTVPEPLTDRDKPHPPSSVRSTEDDSDAELTARQVARFECETDEEDVNISSEEESDIIREIKAEITNKVKLEMVDELSAPMELTLHSRSDLATNCKENTDPKLKAAILKMRKLDRILEKKFAEEKEVKRNHMAANRQLYEKLDQWNRENGRCVSKEESKNTEAFLALTYPTSPDHDRSENHSRSTANGVDYAYRDDDASVTPIFATQLPFEFGRKASAGFGCEGVNSMSSISTNGTGKTLASASPGARHFPASGRGARRSNKSTNGVCSAFERSTSADESTRGGQSRNKSNRGRRNTDFIQRNIQLATEAGAVMTGEERKRLDELLCDLETIPEMLSKEENREENSKTAVVEFRESDGGYAFGSYDRQRMNDIDDRLKALLPVEDYMLVRSVTPSRGLALARRRGSGDTQGSEEDGVRDNFSGKELRLFEDGIDLGARLRDVDDRLSRLATADEHEDGYTPPLSRVRLQALLDDCVQTSSRLSSRQVPSCSSPMSPIPEHPRLDEEVLKRLLADARKNSLSTCDDTNKSDDVGDSVSRDNVSHHSLPEVGGGTNGVQNTRPRETNGSQDTRPQESFYSNNYDANSAWRLLPDQDKNLSPSRGASSVQRSLAQAPRSNSATFGSARASGGVERSAERSSAEIVRRPFLPEIDPSGTLTSAGRRSFSQGKLNGDGENQRIVAPLSGTESSSGKGGTARVRNSLTSEQHDYESRLEK